MLAFQPSELYPGDGQRTPNLFMPFQGHSVYHGKPMLPPLDEYNGYYPICDSRISTCGFLIVCFVLV